MLNYQNCVDQGCEVDQDWYVDQYDDVYDGDGFFRCKWICLSDTEKEIIGRNFGS